MARRSKSKPAPAQAPQAPAADAPAAPIDTVEQEEVVEQTAPPPADERPIKPVGTSNLACTIRGRRKSYIPAIAPSGKKTANNGDRVARILLATPLSELSAFVLQHSGKRYDHLNTGHERMCCGNLVRAWSKQGDVATAEWLDAHDPLLQTQAEEA